MSYEGTNCYKRAKRHFIVSAGNVREMAMKENRIGVQRLVVMPSKLWRFEWSGEGIEVLCYDFPKSGTYIYLILLLKTEIEVSYYDFPKSGTYIYLILLLKTPLGHFIYSLRELGSRFARTLSLHSKQIWIFFSIFARN